MIEALMSPFGSVFVIQRVVAATAYIASEVICSVLEDLVHVALKSALGMTNMRNSHLVDRWGMYCTVKAGCHGKGPRTVVRYRWYCAPRRRDA